MIECYGNAFIPLSYLLYNTDINKLNPDQMKTYNNLKQSNPKLKAKKSQKAAPSAAPSPPSPAETSKSQKRTLDLDNDTGVQPTAKRLKRTSLVTSEDISNTALYLFTSLFIISGFLSVIAILFVSLILEADS
jgi:hypothetical protein